MAYNLGSIGAANISAGLGAGLQALTQNKMEEIKLNKLRGALQGLPKEAQDFVMYTAQHDPKNFHKLVPLLQGIPAQGQQQDAMQMIGQQQQQPNQQDQSGLGMLQNKQQSMAPQNIFGQNVSQPIDLAQQKLEQQRDIATEKSLEPFLKVQGEDYRNAQVLHHKAKGMLDILEKNKKNWPNQYLGAITPDVLYSNPDIRKYLSDANSLVTALANSRKGQPTGFKIRFEQLAKPNLSQPYETQKALLKDIVKESERVFETHKFLEKEREGNNGKYPKDIRERLVKHGLGDALSVNESVPKISDIESKQDSLEQDDEGNLYLNGRKLVLKD